jgi:hypothetical protein
VLSTEDRDAYSAMLHKIMQAIKPRDIIEALLVEEFVHQTSEGFRYRQIENEIMEIERIEKALNPSRLSTRGGCSRCRVQAGPGSGNRQREAAVPAALAAHVQEEDEKLEFGPLSDGLRDNIEAHERVDKLHGVVGRRRDQTLQTLDAYRTLRRLAVTQAEPAIDADFVETEETEQATEHEDAPEQQDMISPKETRHKKAK